MAVAVTILMVWAATPLLTVVAVALVGIIQMPKVVSALSTQVVRLGNTTVQVVVLALVQTEAQQLLQKQAMAARVL